MKTLADLFDDQCRRSPQADAVVAGGDRFTFADIHSWSARLSLALAPCVTVGQRVALLLPNSAPFAAVVMAAARLGGVLAPLDPRASVPDLARRLAALDAAALVTDAAGMAAAVTATTDLLDPPAIVRMYDGAADVIERRASAARALTGSESPPLLQLTTVGATGADQEVVRTHAQVLTEIKTLRHVLGLAPSDRFLAPVPWSDSAALVTSLLSALTTAASVHPIAAFRARDVLAHIERERVTVFGGVPAMFALLAHASPTVTANLGSLRIAFTSGAALGSADSHAFHARYGRFVGHLHATRVTGTIGLGSGGHGEPVMGSIGRPLPGVKVKLLADGEIAVQSPFAATEFLDDPAATATCFRGGYYLSGDLGAKAPDGTISVIGPRPGRTSQAA